MSCTWREGNESARLLVKPKFECNKSAAHTCHVKMQRLLFSTDGLWEVARRKKKKKSVTAYPLNRIPRVTLLWHSSYCAVSPVMGKSNLSQPLETELKLWNSSLGNVPFLHRSIFECACALWTLLDLFFFFKMTAFQPADGPHKQSVPAAQSSCFSHVRWRFS